MPAPAATPAPPTPGLPAEAPKIAISGGVYSASAAQRMLIVNGQVFNEGSEVAPGVTVEEIKARTVVLKFKGTRYTVAY
jgi:general secretion pathway protein B